MSDIELKIKETQTKLQNLIEVRDFNIKQVETRGRKQKFKEPLTETICFMATKSQKAKLDILKEKDITVSDYCRHAVFGDMLKYE